MITNRLLPWQPGSFFFFFFLNIRISLLKQNSWHWGPFPDGENSLLSLSLGMMLCQNRDQLCLRKHTVHLLTLLISGSSARLGDPHPLGCRHSAGIVFPTVGHQWDLSQPKKGKSHLHLRHHRAWPLTHCRRSENIARVLWDWFSELSVGALISALWACFIKLLLFTYREQSNSK